MRTKQNIRNQTYNFIAIGLEDEIFKSIKSGLVRRLHQRRIIRHNYQYPMGHVFTNKKTI